MAQARRSHSSKLHPGGRGDFRRNVRADFTRGFLRPGARMPLRRAAASRTRSWLAFEKTLSTLLTRSCNQSRLEMRETARLRRGLPSLDLRVAAIRATE